MRMNVSRRNFFKAAGLGAAGATHACALPGVDAAAVQKPVFPTPVEIAERPRDESVHIALEMEEREVPVAGLSARLRTHNGRFPGSTLRLREGERVELELSKRLSEPTNFHLHGLHVSAPGWDDNVVRHVGRGRRPATRFTVPRESAGTYWYHPHVHKIVWKQLFYGLAGAIVVEGAADAALRGLPEQVLVLKDLELQADGCIASHTRTDRMMRCEGSLLTVDGAERPCPQVPGGLDRLRLLNAKLTPLEHWELVNATGMDHPIHLHAPPFQTYARGGVREPRPVWKDVVNVPAKGGVELLAPLTDFLGKTVMHCHTVEHEDFSNMSGVDVA